MNPITTHMPERHSLDAGINPFSFSGRDNRRTWWAIQIVAFWVMAFIVNFIDPTGDADLSSIADTFLVGIVVVYTVIALGSHVRRLHDRGKPGAWIFLNLIPIVGSVWLLIQLGFLPGVKRANEYGLPQ